MEGMKEYWEWRIPIYENSNNEKIGLNTGVVIMDLER